MKKYYSPTKEYSKHRPLQLSFKFFRNFFKPSVKGYEISWKTEEPSKDDDVIIVSNHTKINAPAFWLIQKKYKVRVWVNCYFLFYKMCYQHLRNRVVHNLKPKFLFRFLAFICTPIIVTFFRSMVPIPAFHHDEKVNTETFKKSIETFNEGLWQVVFAERTNKKVNKYLYQINYGFMQVAEKYYNETGRCVKFYPSYCCQSLKKVLIGNPYVYNPELSFDEQKLLISRHIEDEIERLGDSLPEHEIVLYIEKEEGEK